MSRRSRGFRDGSDHRFPMEMKCFDSIRFDSMRFNSSGPNCPTTRPLPSPLPPPPIILTMSYNNVSCFLQEHSQAVLPPAVRGHKGDRHLQSGRRNNRQHHVLTVYLILLRFYITTIGIDFSTKEGEEENSKGFLYIGNWAFWTVFFCVSRDLSVSFSSELLNENASILLPSIRRFQSGIPKKSRMWYRIDGQHNACRELAERQCAFYSRKKQRSTSSSRCCRYILRRDVSHKITRTTNCDMIMVILRPKVPRGLGWLMY